MIDRNAVTRSRFILLGLIAAAVIYKALNEIGQGGTSLLFIGLPAALAVIVTLGPPAKSAHGTVLKTITLMILIAAILMVEGAVCIVMASPLLYGVGLAVAHSIDRKHKAGGNALHVSLLIPIVLLSLQGTIPGSSGPRGIVGSSERVVSASPDAVAAALTTPVRFSSLPVLFRYGQFSRPLSCEVREGELVIHFKGNEPRRHKLTFGGHHVHPELVLRIKEMRPGRIVFVPVADTTMMSHWARLQSSTVEWSRVPDGTRVRWTLRARRLLDPIWYFGPLETYAAHRAAAYLVNTVVPR